VIFLCKNEKVLWGDFFALWVWRVPINLYTLLFSNFISVPFFLNQINKRFKEAKYGLVQIEVGEGFDAVNQVDLSQNSRGIVTECVFYGYGFLKEKENPDDEDVITRIIKSPLVLTA